jgi:probable rRNA maturation factor
MADNSNSLISFFFIEAPSILKNRNKLKEFLFFLFKSEGKKIKNLNYIFSNDKTLLKINLHYLNHNFFTDVISFNLSNNSKEIVGDIYISIPRIKENSLIFKTSISNELHRVIFHGALHLCGYKDKSISQKKAMRSREDLYLNLYHKMFHVKL